MLGDMEDILDEVDGPPYSNMMLNLLKGNDVEIFLAN